jgi:hypothetical protein
MQVRADIGSVDRGVAPSRPAGPAANEPSMIDLSDDHASRAELDLGMAFQAEIVVWFMEHLAVNGAMGLMADGAAFPERLVFEGKGPRLFAMALRAAVIQAGHGQPAGGSMNVRAVRVVALDAIHLALDHRMVMRQAELRVGVEMALETGGRIPARVDDKLAASAARGDVPAAGPVARLASGGHGLLEIIPIETSVRAGRKVSGDVCVAFRAGAVSDKRGACNVRGDHDRAFQGGA